MRVDNRSMQKLLMDVDAKSLATALKGATDAIRDKVLGNLSKRAQENLKDALAAVEQMLTRVAEDKLVYVPQMEPIRRDLANAKPFSDSGHAR